MKLNNALKPLKNRAGAFGKKENKYSCKGCPGSREKEYSPVFAINCALRMRPQLSSSLPKPSKIYGKRVQITKMNNNKMWSFFTGQINVKFNLENNVSTSRMLA